MTVEPGEPTVVVQSILSRSHRDQFVVVEYSFNGDTAGRLGADIRIPPGRPQIPISGATVTLSYDSPGPCAGRVDILRENQSNAASIGTYRLDTACVLTPGQRVHLRVETPHGEVVTGTTVIPGITSRSITSGGQTARFAMDTLPMYRERDTLRMRLEAVSGRALAVEVRRAENHADLSLLLFSDSLGLAMPGVLTNPFKNDGVPAFRPGRYHVITTALADSNYFDFLRSVSDPVTARGFLNHLEGGVGVFGSVDAEQYIVGVRGDQHDPREGTYRFTGRVDSINIDFTLDVYLNEVPGGPGGEFATLVGGKVWTTRQVAGVPGGVPITLAATVSGEGAFGLGQGLGGGSTPDGFQLFFQVLAPQPPLQPRFAQYNLRGVRTSNSSPFPVDVTITARNGGVLRRTIFTAQQVSGPNQGN